MLVPFRHSPTLTILLLFFSSCIFATSPADQASLLSAEQQGFFFEENKGQMVDENGAPVPHVLFRLQSAGVTFFLTKDGGTYLYHSPAQFTNNDDEAQAREWERVDLLLKGATIKKENVRKEAPRAHGTVNYFPAHQPAGIKNVQSFGKIIIADIYPHIDWVIYRSNEYGYKYDFVLHPGAALKDIQMIYRSREQLSLQEGQLSLKTQYGTLLEKEPVSFLNGELVASAFRLDEVTRNEYGGYDQSISFDVDAFNRQKVPAGQELIIDPDLIWNTFYGGNDTDQGLDLEVDANGNLFVVGESLSSNFPVFNGGSYFLGNSAQAWDIGFLAKFDAAGTRLWATYYDVGLYDICLDLNGNLFAVGHMTYTGAPVVNSGNGYFQGANAGGADLYVVKFDNAGNRLHATYFGGDGGDANARLERDALGNILLIASTSSTNFPTQNSGGYFQATLTGGSDGTITRFDPNLNMLWSTYLGGVAPSNLTTNSMNELVLVGASSATATFPMVDPGGGAYYQPTGLPAGMLGASSWPLLAKFDANDNVVWSTVFGSTTNPQDLLLNDQIRAVKTDNCGNIFIVGHVDGPGLPIVDPGNDAFIDNVTPVVIAPGPFAIIERKGFISKFDESGTLTWSTYFGGTAPGGNPSGNLAMETNDLEVTDGGELIVVGKATAGDFPVVASTSGYNQANMMGFGDGFISHFTNDGRALWSTHLGGDGHLDAIDAVKVYDGNKVFLTGHYGGFQGGGLVASNSYPTVSPSATSYLNNNFAGGLLDVLLVRIDLSDAYYHTTDSIAESSCNACDGTVRIDLSGYSGPFDFIWSDGVNTLSTTDTFDVRPNLCPGTYTVQVVMNCDTIIQESMTVAGEVVNFQHSMPSTATICEGDELLLQPNVDPTQFDYVWSDGTTTTDRIVTDAGIYTLIFSHNTCILQDSLSISVSVEDCNFSVYVPNAFTPNGDGHNEAFGPHINGEVADYQFLIFNRWGELIFETNEVNTGWDGTIAGRAAESEVYVWKLNMKSANTGEFVHKVGHVVLIR